MKRNIPVTMPYFTDNEIESITKVLQSGWVAQGPVVAEFERLIAEHEGVKYGIATTSCTTALHLALVSMGIGAGDDVLVPSFTFVATANAVTYTGATPIFTDICLDTFNISTDSVLNVIYEKYHYNGEVLVNKSTGNILKAIIPVHLFGLCADMKKVNEIARKYNLKVLEDSACALGAKIDDKHQGTFGVASCISFHPRKSITTGEGGMILTSDENMAAKMYKLRSHGASISEINRHKKGGFLLPDFNELGYNYRMTDIQAAVGICQMKILDWILEQKRDKASYYNKLLEGFDWIITPKEPVGYYHTYQSYVCMINPESFSDRDIKREDFRNRLLAILETDYGVSTRQGTHAVHTLGYYRNKYHLQNHSYPNAYLADKLSITLPLYIQMSSDDQEYVVQSLIKAFNNI